MTCDVDEVILMRSAEYGRMRVGQCISSDAYGNMGCRLDILTLMDSVCSGRHSCDISVTTILDSLDDDSLPCLSQLRGYMEASYSCVRGIPPSTPLNAMHGGFGHYEWAIIA